MALSKGFILKGVAGLAALVGVGAGGTYYYTGGDYSKISKLLNFTGDKRSIPDDVKTVALEGVSIVEKEDELGIPKEECKSEQVTSSTSQTCELTLEQLKRIKFSPKTNKSSVVIDGLKDENKVILTIYDASDDVTTYPKKKKYSFKTESDDKVTIKDLKDQDITIEKNREYVFRENEDKQLEYVSMVDELGIPKRCENSKECELSEDEIKEIKFKDFVDGKTTVDGLSNNKVTLKIESIDNDEENYPKKKKYALGVSNEKVTIKNGSTTIEIEKNKDVLFREKEGKLEGVPTEDNLGIPLVCGADKVNSTTTSKSCQLTAEQLKKIRFETKNGNASIGVTGLTGNSKVELKIEYSTDSTNYPKSKKYSFKSTDKTIKITGTKGGDVELNKNKAVIFVEIGDNKLGKAREVNNLGIPNDCKDNKECSLGIEDIKKIKFKDFANTNVEGLDDSKTIKLKIVSSDDTTTYPKKKKYIFTNSNNNEVKINNGNVEIKLPASTGKEIFRETESESKLEKAPNEDKFGIPTICEADQVKKSGEIKECNLTQDQLKKVKFKALDGGSGDVSIAGLTGTIKLKIEHTEDSTYPNNRKYTLDNLSNSSDVKITQNANKSLTLDKQKTSYFKENDNKLEKIESKTKVETKMEEVNDELKKLGITGLNLSDSDFKENGEISFNSKTTQLNSGALKKIQFKEFNGNGSLVNGLKSSKKIQLELSYTDDVTNFPKNMKFTFTNNNDKDVEIKFGSKNIFIRKTESGKASDQIFKTLGGKLTRSAAK